MKKTLRTLSLLIFVSFSLVPQAQAEPSAQELRQTIRDYIKAQEHRHGAFLILDERGEVLRRLELVGVHERVGKTGDYYYSCTDMKDKKTGDLLDLDFDISDSNNALKVVTIRIHKDNGNARYTYDDNDNLIPVKQEGFREYTLGYKTIVPQEATAEEGTKLWIPLAQSSLGQKILNRTIQTSSEIAYEIQKESVYGNEALYVELDKPLAQDLEIEVTYQVARHEGFTETGVEPVLDKYLKPSRLMIIDQRIKEITSQVIQDESTNRQKAKAIYDYVFDNVDYSKVEPGWGKGDTARVCLIGKGNCTDFHSLFISVARASGVPARFQIGFQVPEGEGGDIAGYHCWAQFLDEEKGWLTVDASEAWKSPDLKEFYFGGFDPNKFHLSTGRDIRLLNQEEGPLNIFFYPYTESAKNPQAIKTQFYYKESTV